MKSKIIDLILKESFASYSAIVLTDLSKNKLINTLKDKIPEGWKIICHHMTVKLGELPDFLKSDLNKNYNLYTEELGISEKAMAVKVSGYKIPDNHIRFPHITIAVNSLKGGKPKDSNDIKEWKKIPRISITGILEEIQ